MSESDIEDAIDSGYGDFESLKRITGIATMSVGIVSPAIPIDST